MCKAIGRQAFHITKMLYSGEDLLVNWRMGMGMGMGMGSQKAQPKDMEQDGREF